MLFKNLRLYRVASLAEINPEFWHERLTQRLFRPCGSLEMEYLGWVPPLGRGAEQLAHPVPSGVVVCARKESRLLPGSVVNSVLAERVAAIEDEEGRKVGRAERKELKDEVIHTLMPRAFTRSSDIQLLVLAAQGWVIANTASSTRAEEVISLLREALGSLPAVPPKTQQDPARTMTGWVSGDELPAGLSLGDECELRDDDSESPATVKAKRLELRSNEIQTHLDASRQVVKLALSWEDRLQFMLDSDLSVKRLSFSDELLESIADVDASDPFVEKDAQFALLALELTQFLPLLLEWFGGEATETSKT